MAGTIPNDTAPDAWAVQREIYQRVGGRGRVEIMFSRIATVRRLAVAGIRARHPEYDDELVRRAYARLMLGDALAAALWPGCDLVDP